MNAYSYSVVPINPKKYETFNIKRHLLNAIMSNIIMVSIKH